MMKSAKTISKIHFLILTVLIVLGCKRNDIIIYPKNESRLFFFDVIGNSDLDTLIIENPKTNKYNKSILILSKGKKSPICEIMPRLDSTFILTSPSIENIYLEANEVQTKNKGFRLLSKNTDVQPEYFFIDFYYNKEWVIKDIGFLNISGKTQFICKKNIEKRITSFGRLINPKIINQIHFNGNYCK